MILKSDFLIILVHRNDIFLQELWTLSGMMTLTQVDALSKQIWCQVLEESVSVDKMNRVCSGFLTSLEWNVMEE